MLSVIDDTVFSEPSGRPDTLIHFAGSVIWLSLYIYAWSVGSAGSSSWFLVMMGAMAVTGIAESLPTSRQWTAGVLRLVAILVLLCIVAAALVAPTLIVG